MIHDAIQAVDRALVGHLDDPQDYEPIQAAIDFSPTRSSRTSRTRSTARSSSRSPAWASTPARSSGAPRFGDPTRPSASAGGADYGAVPVKRFTFRLESLRAVREQAEEQAKAVLGRELALEARRLTLVDAAAGRLFDAGTTYVAGAAG